MLPSICSLVPIHIPSSGLQNLPTIFTLHFCGLSFVTFHRTVDRPFLTVHFMLSLFSVLPVQLFINSPWWCSRHCSMTPDHLPLLLCLMGSLRPGNALFLILFKSFILLMYPGHERDSINIGWRYKWMNNSSESCNIGFGSHVSIHKGYFLCRSIKLCLASSFLD